MSEATEQARAVSEAISCDDLVRASQALYRMADIYQKVSPDHTVLSNMFRDIRDLLKRVHDDMESDMDKQGEIEDLEDRINTITAEKMKSVELLDELETILAAISGEECLDDEEKLTSWMAEYDGAIGKVYYELT